MNSEPATISELAEWLLLNCLCIGPVWYVLVRFDIGQGWVFPCEVFTVGSAAGLVLCVLILSPAGLAYGLFILMFVFLFGFGE